MTWPGHLPFKTNTRGIYIWNKSGYEIREKKFQERMSMKINKLNPS